MLFVTLKIDKFINKNKKIFKLECTLYIKLNIYYFFYAYIYLKPGLLW